MARSFAVTYDYLCPFARNASEAIFEGLRTGREWEVHFVPFSLAQVHVPEGETAAWDRAPGDRRTSGVLALAWSIAVRDHFPARFWDFHLATFAARHDEARQIKDEAVLAEVAAGVELDPDAISAIVAGGDPVRRLEKEHNEALDRWKVFGVPTFIEGDNAVYVRLMERGRLEDVERVLELLPQTGLNEFKRTQVPA